MSSNEAKSADEGFSENKLPSGTHTGEENMELEFDLDSTKGWGASPPFKRDQENGLQPAQTSPVHDQLKEEMEVAEALLKVANTDPPVMNSSQKHQPETSSAFSAANSAPRNRTTSLVLNILNLRERVPSHEQEEQAEFLAENQENFPMNDNQSETTSPRHQPMNSPVDQLNSPVHDYQSQKNSLRPKWINTPVIQVNYPANDHQSEMNSPWPKQINTPVIQVNALANDHQSQMNSPWHQWMNSPAVQVNSLVNDHNSERTSPWPKRINMPVIQVNFSTNDHQSEMNYPWPQRMNSLVTQVNPPVNDQQFQVNSLKPQWMNSSIIQVNTPVNDHQPETNFPRLRRMKAQIDQVHDVPNMHAMNNMNTHGRQYKPPISNLPPEYQWDTYGTTKFSSLNAQNTTELGTRVVGTYEQGNWFPINQSSMEHNFVQAESSIPYRPLQPIQQNLNQSPTVGNIFNPPPGNWPIENQHAYRIYIPKTSTDSQPQEIQYSELFSWAMGSNEAHPTQVSSYRTLSSVPIQQQTVGFNLEPMLPNRSRGSPPDHYSRQGLKRPETHLTLGHGLGESSSSTNHAKRKAIWQDDVPTMQEPEPFSWVDTLKFNNRRNWTSLDSLRLRFISLALYDPYLYQVRGLHIDPFIRHFNSYMKPELPELQLMSPHRNSS